MNFGGVEKSWYLHPQRIKPQATVPPPTAAADETLTCCFLIAELQAEIEEYVVYYNQNRIKLGLKGLSPVQYRAQYLS
ncbi:hypothetical protein DPV92_08475 [Haemophilus paraphrohaemolyticus]|uniref:Integrase catalytic domain-containing protein n=1 Tax=Haemophilus paraphrohaemolyticus TaxID=736 RepID=A0A369ZR01_9PAST|nr:hypothetical protein DPV92_08475 [Haemophilus paraphrohaemolyticus]